ncbi:uncharacterized protein LOC123314434 [Coccinella septempunctata]|uniref:uncharacterized protein LOC123314434 n=1 Tax=Coccinella septempunctata TaxID=41139 RepID=UPI001D0958E5|nr:uncharacterized protein LOC123314434 [Coccinella septempunctata]
MKTHLIFLILVLSSCSEGNISDDIEEDVGRAQAILLFYLTSVGVRQCETHSHEDLVAQQTKAIECVKNITYDGTFCESFPKKFKPCVSNILAERGQCDSPFMNALKNSVMDSVIAEIEYLCSINGERILELVNPCVITSALQGYKCKTDVMRPYQSSSLPEACRVFPDVLNCLEKEIKNECEKELTRKTLHDFFSVEVKPCNVAIEGYMELIKFISRKYEYIPKKNGNCENCGYEIIQNNLEENK